MAENASLLIATRIIPKREAAILVTNELQTLNRNAYVEQQTETATLYRDIHERYWRTFGMAVLATLSIALFLAVHVSRLERRLRLEQEKDARTAAELQRLSAKLVSAQEEERRAIARELHDEIGQVLTAVKMELAHTQRYIASLGGDKDFLDDARSITDRALDAARDMSHLLHPSVLDDLGLPAAVDGYVQRINKRQDLRVDVHGDEHGRGDCRPTSRSRCTGSCRKGSRTSCDTPERGAAPSSWSATKANRPCASPSVTMVSGSIQRRCARTGAVGSVWWAFESG